MNHTGVQRIFGKYWPADAADHRVAIITHEVAVFTSRINVGWLARRVALFERRAL